ncbi:hypothetical protein [Miltoncostaea marina]|nr:hypothetical protein [Miltoncostaea marina]
MGRVKLVYWSLLAVLAALTFFLVAAGARVLRGRPAGGGADAPPG